MSDDIRINFKNLFAFKSLLEKHGSKSSLMVVNILSFWGWLWRVNCLRSEVKNRLKRIAQISLPEVGERTSFSWKKSTGCVNAKQTRDFIRLQNDKVSTSWIFVFSSLLSNWDLYMRIYQGTFGFVIWFVRIERTNFNDLCFISGLVGY